MRKILLCLTILMIMTDCKSKIEVSGSVRPMAVAGQFYPADKDSLVESLKASFSRAHAAPRQGVRALIVPHAGYVFSADVAAEAFATLPADAHYRRIFLLGPSHHTGFDGASVCGAYDYYETPLGRVPVDTATCKALLADSVFTFKPEAHSREHCLEVQLPFLQYRLGDVPPIVPIVIGTENFSKLRAMAEALRPYFTSDNLFVISSDFSHYPSYADAQRVDGLTGKALEACSLDKFIEALRANMSQPVPNLATCACGECAIAILLMLAQDDSQLSMQHLKYQNSGDSRYGGKGEVVGYHAFCLQQLSDITLNADDRRELLWIARHAITGTRLTDIDASALSPVLRRKLGAFVTLNKNGRLRGCIGHFGEDIPLYEVVYQMARAAAFEDPRFPEVEQEEMPDIEIEISVLTPLKRIHDISEFHYGQQGIYMRKGYHSGTFLPQVADEVNWTKEEFLGHCARDKAGIGWDGWRDAELYTYEAIIVKEK